MGYIPYIGVYYYYLPKKAREIESGEKKKKRTTLNDGTHHLDDDTLQFSQMLSNMQFLFLLCSYICVISFGHTCFGVLFRFYLKVREHRSAINMRSQDKGGYKFATQQSHRI